MIICGVNRWAILMVMTGESCKYPSKSVNWDGTHYTEKADGSMLFYETSFCSVLHSFNIRREDNKEGQHVVRDAAEKEKRQERARLFVTPEDSTWIVMHNILLEYHNRAMSSLMADAQEEIDWLNRAKEEIRNDMDKYKERN